MYALIVRLVCILLLGGVLATPVALAIVPQSGVGCEVVPARCAPACAVVGGDGVAVYSVKRGMDGVKTKSGCGMDGIDRGCAFDSGDVRRGITIRDRGSSGKPLTTTG